MKNLLMYILILFSLIFLYGLYPKYSFRYYHHNGEDTVTCTSLDSWYLQEDAGKATWFVKGFYNKHEIPTANCIKLRYGQNAKYYGFISWSESIPNLNFSNEDSRYFTIQNIGHSGIHINIIGNQEFSKALNNTNGKYHLYPEGIFW